MKQSIKISNQSVKIMCIMQNVEFADLTQTTNFYTQELFQSIFLTSM